MDSLIFVFFKALDLRRNRDRRETRKDSAARIGVGHGSNLCQTLAITEPLIIEEEKRFVFLDRSAKTASELVAAKSRQLGSIAENSAIASTPRVVPSTAEPGPWSQKFWTLVLSRRNA